MDDNQILMRVLHSPTFTSENEELSIDKLLSELENGNSLGATANMDQILHRLVPIFEQLNDKQKISIIDGTYKNTISKKNTGDN